MLVRGDSVASRTKSAVDQHTSSYAPAASFRQFSTTTKMTRYLT